MLGCVLCVVTLLLIFYFYFRTSSKPSQNSEKWEIILAKLYETFPNSMSAWQIDDYRSNLYLNDAAPLPKILNPDDILIEIKAASVNPIDTMMKEGYGAALFEKLRKLKNRACFEKGTFPLTLGRDCSGIVRAVGETVNKFKPGDTVYTATGLHRQGTLAQYTVTEECSVAHKPQSLDFDQSASIAYVTGTVWMALCTIGGLNRDNCKDLNILIHGGTGGIGTFATQLVRAWGAKVVSTCSSNSRQIAVSMGATPVDYNSKDAFEKLKELGPYDVILDTAGSDLASDTVELLGVWRRCVFVTLTTPLMLNIDRLGLPLGLLTSAAQFGRHAFWALCKGRKYRWCYFQPNGAALEEVAELLDEGKIEAIVERIVSMKKVPEAFELVAKKHGRGKTVIHFSD